MPLSIDWIELAGQVLGIIAVILGFITYQMRSQKAILIVNMITCGVFCVHYLLIGAVTGFAMHVAALVRNLVYTNRERKPFDHPVWPVIFAAIMLGAGILSWEGLPTILMICALVINTLCLSLKNPQYIRISLLVSCPLVLLYDVLMHSYGGIAYEAMSIISAAIGIIRFRKESTPA